MGPRKLWPDKAVAAFPAGTFARMRAVLQSGEDRTDFMRRAVERELQRLERAADKAARKDGDPQSSMRAEQAEGHLAGVLNLGPQGGPANHASFVPNRRSRRSRVE
jgi:hypothetical protein